jgi:hypothetical protein
VPERGVDAVRRTAFADLCPVAVGQPDDLVVDAGRPGGVVQGGVTRSGGSEAQVVRDRGVEEVRLLGDDRDAATQRVERVRAGVEAVDEDPAAVRIRAAEQQAEERRLAGAGGSDDRRDTAGGGGEGHPLESRAPASGMREVHVLEADFGGGGPRGDGPSRVGYTALRGTQTGDTVGGRHPEVPGVPFPGEVPHGTEAFGREHQHQIRAGGGRVPRHGGTARDERGGDRAALHGEVGESGVDERDAEFGDRGAVQFP